jgi:hypothetical protein
MTLIVGVAATVFGTAHLYGVIVTAIRRVSCRYDFRFAALMIVGTLIVIAGLLCLASVRSLTKGRRPAWVRAVSGTVLLLLVAVPLVPVQPELAGMMSLLGALNLIALLGARGQLEAD